MPALRLQQSVATPRSKSCQARYAVRAASCMLALLLNGTAGAHAKRLVAFGDSITDNGNGTHVYVQLWYAELLKRTEPFTVGYPPPPAYWDSRWSNGPTWIEYLADMVDGYELHNCAVGYAVTNASNSLFSVGDMWPNDLLSNKKGMQNVILPTLADQVDGYLTQNTVLREDTVVIQIGNNDLVSFFIVDFFQSLQAVESRKAAFPAYIMDYVTGSIQDALEALYHAGGRKFMVWDVMAGELLPMVNTGNWLLNMLNTVLAHAHKQLPDVDALKTYVAQFCDVTNAAIRKVWRDFAARHPDALVVGIPAADLQRWYAANSAALGFVDVTHGCSSLFTIANYKTGDEFCRADPTATFPAAAATLAVTPLLVRKLDNWSADLYGLHGPESVPSSVMDCLHKLHAIFTYFVDKANTLGHIMGFVLSSKPLGKGGFSPYNAVPTCQYESGDHLYHDEVHPTTRHHHLLAKDVMARTAKLFK